MTKALETLVCSQRRVSSLPIAASEAELLRYMEQPERPIAALLTRRRLQILGSDRFLYRSRPYQLLGYTIQPRLRFLVEWQAPVLRIEFERCRIQGLGDWQDAVRFGGRALLTVQPGLLVAESEPQLRLRRSGPSALLPAAMVKLMANQALVMTLDRLEQRCRHRLTRAIESWLETVS